MKVTAIVPAYNEEKTIASVVDVLVAAKEIDQVVVVSDGSTDCTGVVASESGATVITLPQNLGKGGALAAGVKVAEGDYIMFIDADLIGFSQDHIQKLLAPIITGQAQATLGVFRKGRLATDWAHKLAPGLSGQRVLKASLLEDMTGVEASRFGVEVALNRLLARRQVKTVAVDLPFLTQIMKEEKLGFWKGFGARLKMYKEIISYRLK